MLPHRGPVVAELTSRQAEGIYQVRIGLEGLACQLFAQRASEAHRSALGRAFNDLRSSFKDPDPLSRLHAKNRFYDCLVDGSGNEALGVSLRHAERACDAAPIDLASRPRSRLSQSIAELTELMEALMARDDKRARKAAVSTCAKRGPGRDRSPREKAEAEAGMKLKLLGAVLAIGLNLTAALAQEYPSRVITMVVPFAAGGPGDTIARLIGQAMSQTLKQQIIIENALGAGGTIGTHRVARAAPDGYTLLLMHTGQATSVSLYRKLPYDPVEDFEKIGLVTDVSMLVVGKPNLPPNDLKELVAYIRERGDQVLYAHSGIGSAAHLCGLVLMNAIGGKDHRSPVQGRRPCTQRPHRLAILISTAIRPPGRRLTSRPAR